MKTIFICADGTWNTTDQSEKDSEGRRVLTPTNVAKIARIISTNRGKENGQLVYYDRGVGTGGTIDKFVGGGVGKGLYKNVKESYKFLVENYEPGDRIAIFGFSRGAYTARCIVGMITKMGILRKKYVADIASVFNLYKGEKDKGFISQYKKHFCHEDNEILFVGVWDTVGALGIPVKGFNIHTRKHLAFLDPSVESNVLNAFHAVAIDEKRHSFAPTLWKKNPDNKVTNIEQRWFAGVHSNIGGSYADKGLSDITLKWMIDKMVSSISGLVIDESYGIDPDSSGVLVDSCGLVDKFVLPYSIRDPYDSTYANSVIDDSVLERKNDDRCKYNPKKIKFIKSPETGKVILKQP